MKRLIIFASGEGKATEKIVKLFNGGNRIHTDLIFVDKDHKELRQSLQETGANIIVLSPEIWEKDKIELLEKIEQNNPDLIVLDNWESPIPAEIARYSGYHVVCVTETESAPTEVVATLESIDAPVDTSSDDVNEPKSMDQEWADTLKINFEPPKIPQDGEIPPPLPPQQPENFENPSSFENVREERGPDPRNTEFRHYHEGQQERNHHWQQHEPMPSTYLIWSVLCTIFCCFIPGIVAIIFSSQVSSRYFSGDIEGARRASRNAEIWIIVSFILGVLSATVFWPLWFF